MKPPTLPLSSNGKALTLKKLFSRETAVSIEINAAPMVIWRLLTHAAGYPKWNSTIVSIQGEIKSGEKIKLTSTLAPKRTFVLKITEYEAEKRLVWADAQGKRVYTLTDSGKQSVIFSMSEKIGGLFYPLYARYIPSFDQAFEQFAADLKKEAELNAKR